MIICAISTKLTTITVARDSLVARDSKLQLQLQLQLQLKYNNNNNNNNNY